MVTLLRCRRLLPPLFRARFLAITLTASFLAYIYLLHSAHSIHVSRLSYSPTCQPVAAESSRAIQILRELQVTAASPISSPSCLLLTHRTGSAASSRIRKLRLFQPVLYRRLLGLGHVAPAAMALKNRRAGCCIRGFICSFVHARALVCNARVGSMRSRLHGQHACQRVDRLLYRSG